MKRIAALITILLLATSLLAQETPDNTKLRTRIFEVHNRTTRDLALSIKPLGSGSKGTEFSWNDDLHTITVRDFPENIASMDEALTRLDKATPLSAEVEFKVSLLIGSKTALNGPGLPEDLEPVVKQLKSTLRYSQYGLLAANIHRTRVGEGIEGSGIAESTLIGNTSSNPVFYDYTLRNIRLDGGVVSVENMKFGMRVPIKINDHQWQYQNVGFTTPVSIKPNEKVVIGTTTMGDRAVIVVLVAKAGD